MVQSAPVAQLRPAPVVNDDGDPGHVAPARVIVARSEHAIPDRGPIQLEVGERVAVGERDTEWPAFVFVTAAQGSGWVPERNLARDGVAAVVIEAYDTTELPVPVGGQVEVLREDQLSGWFWCRASDGREGWVPTRAFEPSASPPW